MTARRTPPRGTPAPAVLAGGMRRFDDESDPFAAKASAPAKTSDRDRGVDSAGNAALAEEVARLRAQLADAREAEARRCRDVADTLERLMSERAHAQAEVERLTAERASRGPSDFVALLDSVATDTPGVEGHGLRIDADVVELTVDVGGGSASARIALSDLDGRDLAETAEDIVSRLVRAAREASPW